MRKKVVAILVVAIIAIAGAGYYVETSSESTSETVSETSPNRLTLTESPANQECSSNSLYRGNLSWTEAGVGANETDMRVLVLAVNSSSTASLCVSYSQNPEAAGFSGMTDVNISAWVGVPPLQENQCASNSISFSAPPSCGPDVSVTAQPDHLSFANGSSNQQFFVRLAITVPSNSSGYYILGVSGLCSFAGIILNLKPSEITASALSHAYTNLYTPSCGPLYGAIGHLVGLSGLSYGYATEPMY